MFDPGTPAGRTELGLAEDGLQGTTFMRFRLRPGEDGSCLNLYKPTSPRIIAPAKAFVDADIGTSDNSVRITTRNVSALTLSFAPGECPLDQARPTRVFIDGHKPSTPRVQSDRSWLAHFQKVGTRWEVLENASEDETRLFKKHDLQGPIDDAFMSSFIFVRPTGRFAHPAVEQWARAELAHAIEHWRRQFRGQAQVKDDTAITEQDLAQANLVLWGDPTSNVFLGKIIAKIPLHWSDTEVAIGDKRFPAAGHAPILIYPNPLNRKRYVVVNSSFTYREYDYLNNARQTPKLPDWAIVDLSEPPNSRFPGKIVAANFFDETWSVKRGEKLGGR
jgi:hypothetical protein